MSLTLISKHPPIESQFSSNNKSFGLIWFQQKYFKPNSMITSIKILIVLLIGTRISRALFLCSYSHSLGIFPHTFWHIVLAYRFFFREELYPAKTKHQRRKFTLLQNIFMTLKYLILIYSCFQLRRWCYGAVDVSNGGQSVHPKIKLEENCQGVVPHIFDCFVMWKTRLYRGARCTRFPFQNSDSDSAALL